MPPVGRAPSPIPAAAINTATPLTRPDEIYGKDRAAGMVSLVPVCAVRHGGRDLTGAHPQGDRPPGQGLDRSAGPQAADRHREPDRLILPPYPGSRGQAHGCVR